MTALERAATTVAACLVDAPVAPTFSMADVNGWTEEKAYEIARAVLMAVREPDDGTIGDGYETMRHREVTTHKDARVCFTAMIDAILNEKDTTND